MGSFPALHLQMLENNLLADVHISSLSSCLVLGDAVWLEEAGPEMWRVLLPSRKWCWGLLSPRRSPALCWEESRRIALALSLCPHPRLPGGRGWQCRGAFVFPSVKSDLGVVLHLIGSLWRPISIKI